MIAQKVSFIAHPPATLTRSQTKGKVTPLNTEVVRCPSQESFSSDSFGSTQTRQVFRLEGHSSKAQQALQAYSTNQPRQDHEQALNDINQIFKVDLYA